MVCVGGGGSVVPGLGWVELVVVVWLVLVVVVVLFQVWVGLVVGSVGGGDSVVPGLG